MTSRKFYPSKDEPFKDEWLIRDEKGNVVAKTCDKDYANSISYLLNELFNRSINIRKRVDVRDLLTFIDMDDEEE